MWPEGAQDITETTKRPITAGTNFKNSIIALVDNLATKVRLPVDICETLPIRGLLLTVYKNMLS